MEKTAMQALIDEIEKLISIKSFQKWEGLKTEYLAKEQQQIIDAHAKGQVLIFETIKKHLGGFEKTAAEVLKVDNGEDDVAAMDYFTQTFGK